MKLGIVGLPNVGKSSLFNALTGAGAASENYPFCTIDPNIGIVSVPDKRMDFLAGIYHPAKFTPAVVEFVDIAGLVKGASKGEGLGNKFLSHIREVDAILHVVRCFDSTDVTHVEGSVNSVRDAETINFELIFADLDTIEKRLVRSEKMIKSGDKRYKRECEILEKIKAGLEKGIFVGIMDLGEEEKSLISELFLLTDKPMLYAANVSEDDAAAAGENPEVAALTKLAKAQGAEVMGVCAKLEEELSMLDPTERELFLSEMGVSQSGLDKLIQKSYKLLNLISFLTAGEKEVRAWTIVRGTKAPAAAGKIHSDFERGFIRAEIVSFNDLVACKDMATARARGLVRQEGKEYVMQDGDVTLFKFNV
ncbi:MAG: redox-regulated ATPase YchF [Christensenellales bacterium]|jgi:GTP-binding protein YchF